MPIQKIKEILVQSGLTFTKGRKGIRKDLEEKIVQLCKDGNNLPQIKEEVHKLTIPGIRKILMRHGLRVKKGLEKISEETQNSIAELAKECKTQRELQKRTRDMYKVTPYFVQRIVKEKGISIERKTRSITERDALILQGLSLKTIAEHEGVTSERIRQYINSSGQYKTWKTERQKRKQQEKDERELPKARKEIAELIDLHILEKTKEEQGWAYAKATEYFIKARHTDLPFEKVLALFKAYENAVQNKETLSLTKLSEKAGFDKWYISNNILKAAGLPLFNPPRAYSLSEEQRQAVINGKDISYFTATDVAFFAGCTSAWAAAFKDSRIPREKRKEVHIGYAKCSMIYEAQDAGFTMDEICEYVNLQKRSIIFKALGERPTIEPNITNALKIMYPNRNITKPYL